MLTYIRMVMLTYLQTLASETITIIIIGIIGTKILNIAAGYSRPINPVQGRMQDF